MIPVGTVPGQSSGRIRNTPGISCSKVGMEGELCPSRGRIKRELTRLNKPGYGCWQGNSSENEDPWCQKNFSSSSA